MTISRNISVMAQGASTAGILSGAYGGIGANVSPTTAGNVLFTADGSVWSSAQKIVRATVQTPTSGVSVGFTSIPSWVKRITMLLSGISTTGTSDIAVQIGSGSYVTSGYVGSSAFVSQSSFAAGGAALTTAFTVSGIIAAGTSSGVVTLYNLTGNVWNYAATMTRNGGTTAQNGVQTTVYIPLTLSGALDRIQLLSSNGTDTFDAGSVNILYE